MLGRARIALLLCATITGGALSTLPVTPAAAATPTCTTAVRHLAAHLDALVPAAARGNINCTLEQGNSSRAVEALQQNLNGCYRGTGSELLTVDGEFGTKTRSALVRAQRLAGATPDGVYGPNTRRAFLWDTGDGCHPLV